MRRTNQAAGTIGAAIACLLFVVSAVAATLPEVHVTFEFRAQLFDGLTEQERAEVAAEVAAAITERANDRWGFVDWTALPANEAAAQWTVVLEQEDVELPLPQGPVKKSTVRLKHFGTAPGFEAPLQRNPSLQILYDLASPKPTQDHLQLRDDILARLGVGRAAADQPGQLQDLLNGLEMEVFLKKIPLGSQVHTDSGSRRVVIPFKLTDLEADFNTIFGVVFKDTNSRRGELDLKAVEIVHGGPHDEFAIVKITEVDSEALENMTIPTSWDDRLPGVLSTALEVTVFMFQYQWNPGGTSVTSDGIVTDSDL